MKKQKERGAAGIIVEFSDGKVTVKHSEDGTVLMKAIVYHGYWDNLWSALESKEFAKIKMRVK